MTMPGRQELMDALGAAVRAYQRSTDALDDTIADRLGVNRTDLRCLDWLFDGPLTVGQLAEATGLSSAATTALLDRLETKGFVRRVRTAADRRKVVVEMTDVGQGLAGQLYSPLAAAGAVMLERYSDAEIALLRDYLIDARELTDTHCVRLREQPPGPTPRDRPPHGRSR